MYHRHACVQEQQAAHKASLAAAESALRKAEAATASAEGAASAANDAMEGAAATAMASIQQAALSAATDAGTPKLALLRPASLWTSTKMGLRLSTPRSLDLLSFSYRD